MRAIIGAACVFIIGVAWMLADPPQDPAAPGYVYTQEVRP